MDDIYDNDDQETPQAKWATRPWAALPVRARCKSCGVRAPTKSSISSAPGDLRTKTRGGDVSEIHKAHEEGRTVRYTGRLDDPDYPNIKEVDTEVRITSIGTYHTTPQEGGDEGEERTFYNYDVTARCPTPMRKFPRSRSLEKRSVRELSMFLPCVNL